MMHTAANVNNKNKLLFSVNTGRDGGNNGRFPAWKNESLNRMCVRDSSVALS